MILNEIESVGIIVIDSLRVKIISFVVDPELIDIIDLEFADPYCIKLKVFDKLKDIESGSVTVIVTFWVNVDAVVQLVIKFVDTPTVKELAVEIVIACAVIPVTEQEDSSILLLLEFSVVTVTVLPS